MALVCVVLVVAQIHRDVASAQTSQPAPQASGSPTPLVCGTTPASFAQGAKIEYPKATSLIQPDFRSISAPSGTAKRTCNRRIIRLRQCSGTVGINRYIRARSGIVDGACRIGGAPLR